MAVVTLAEPKSKSGLPALFRFPAGTVACGLLDRFMQQEPEEKSKAQAAIGSDRKLLLLEEMFLKHYGKVVSSVEKKIRNGNYSNREGFTPWCSAVFPLLDHYAYVPPGAKKTQYVAPEWRKYDSRTLELFSMVLPKYAGFDLFSIVPSIFLSWLIHTGRHTDYTLHLESTGASMDYLCEANWKKVRIFGDVGDHFADDSGGAIAVHGSVGNNAANHFGSRLSLICMPILEIYGGAGHSLGSGCHGCTIILHGSCGDEAGNYLGPGAKLIIKGNAGWKLGSYMHSGEIHVSGNIQSLGSEITGGNIFQNGRQLVRNGKIIDKPINK